MEEPESLAVFCMHSNCNLGAISDPRSSVLGLVSCAREAPSSWNRCIKAENSVIVEEDEEDDDADRLPHHAAFGPRILRHHYVNREGRPAALCYLALS